MSSPRPIPHIVSLHAEQAAFLWLLRDAVVRAPHYNLADLAHLDSRNEAHLDGLHIAGTETRTLCTETLGQQEPGDRQQMRLGTPHPGQTHG